MDQELEGRRIAALAADGFEKVELVVPMKALKAAGAEVDVISLRDGNLVTSRGPQDLVPFVKGCLDVFAQHAPISKQQQQSLTDSSPQANEPPEIVLGAMKWLPKPSLRTALGLGAIAAVFLATK